LVLGQYRLLAELGAGGFGQVYRALHTVMGRTVAVKVIAPHLLEDGQARAWFKREVQATTQLYHPNIVMAYDANEDDGLLFLVMEYIDGQDLDSVVQKQGPLPISVAFEILRQAGQALQHAHERRMVHRDIKPANLLIPRSAGLPGVGSPADRAAILPPPAGAAPVMVKVVDFGLARLYSSVGGNTMKSQGEQGFLGTPDYVSPEQARNAGSADIRSDLYSLGCTFYYALTGCKPFASENAVETLIKHLEKEPTPLEVLRPEVPTGVAAVIRRLMVKDPGKRFQTPAEVVAELDFLAGRDGGTPRPVFGPAPPAAPPPRPVIRPVELPAPPVFRKAPTPSVGAEPAATQVLPTDKLRLHSATAASRTDYAAENDTAELLVGGRTPLLTPTNPVMQGLSRVEMPSPEPGPSPEPAWADELDCAPELDMPSHSGRELEACWREWRSVVEALAMDDSPQIDDSGYRALHREVLGACRVEAATATGERRALLQKLDMLVAPWLSYEVLASTNPTVLASLVANSRHLSLELFGPDRDAVVPLWLAILFILILASSAVVVYFWRMGNLAPV
jgi:serine/threonine protein kinase